MDQLYLLWFLSISMLIGSFLSGLVPMALKLSDSKSRLLALLGSGILVGTALAIIIPEGIDSLYGQQSQPLIVNNQFEQVDTPTSVGKDHETLTEQALDRSTKMNKTWTIGISLVVGFILMLLIDQFTLFQASRDVNRFDDQAELTNHPQNYDYAQVSQDDDIVEDGSRINKELNTSDTELVNGVEVNRKIPRNSETSTSTAATAAAVTTNNYHTNVQMNNPGPNRYYDHSRSASHNRTKATKVTPTLGLVIHAAADGIALGAAATTSHRDVEMIIFLAIMLHKAPAAFSLVVLLLHRGLKYSTIRKHLLAFSLSAPIAAIVTYFGLSQSGKEALRKNNATGIAMLFSAGTFLFVATVHVLPELIHNKLLSPKEMLFLVGGAFLPLLLAQTI